MFVGATRAHQCRNTSTTAKETRLKPSAAFAYRIGGSTITPARSQIRPAHDVSPKRKPIRPEKGRVQFTKKMCIVSSRVSPQKSAVLTVKGTIQLNVEWDVLLLLFMFKRPGRGLMCGIWTLAGCPLVLFLLRHEQSCSQLQPHQWQRRHAQPDTLSIQSGAAPAVVSKL